MGAVCHCRASAPTVTLGLRYVLRVLQPLSAPKLLPGGAGTPILVASAIIAVIYAHVVVQWCGDECRPASVLGYLAYVGSFVYVVLSWSALYFGIKTYRALQHADPGHAACAQSVAHEAQAAHAALPAQSAFPVQHAERDFHPDPGPGQPDRQQAW